MNLPRLNFIDLIGMQYDLNDFEDQATFESCPITVVTPQQMNHIKIFKWIGAFVSTPGPKLMTRGTAFLVSANCILTAAHNILDKNTGHMYKNFRFYPGISGLMSQHKYYTPEIKNGRPTIYVPKQYTQQVHGTYSNKYDYAFVKLSQDVKIVRQVVRHKHQVIKEEDKEFMKLGINFPTESDQELLIFGYPAKNDDNFISMNYVSNQGSNDYEVKQYGAKAKIKDIQLGIDKKNKVNTYKISTLGGQSGCPVITGSENTEYLAVGIHIAGNGKQFNMARQITLDLVIMLDLWCQKNDCQTCTVIDLRTRKPFSLGSNVLVEVSSMVQSQRAKQHYHHNTKVQLATKNLKEVANCVKKFDEKERNMMKRLTMQLKTSIHLANKESLLHGFTEWDTTTPYAKQFNCEGTKITKKSEFFKQFYQMTSFEPIPCQSVSRFLIKKYGGLEPIIIGVITKNRKNEQWTGEKQDKCPCYWTRGQNTSQNSVGEGDYLEMQVDKIRETITFKKNNPERIVRQKLPRQFITEQVFIFVTMKEDWACVQIVV